MVKRKVPIYKRDVIVENHCLIQESPFDVSNFFKVLATSLISYLFISKMIVY